MIRLRTIFIMEMSLDGQGTILTFFHWPNIPKGHRGTSQVIATAFLVPGEFYRLLDE